MLLVSKALQVEIKKSLLGLAERDEDDEWCRLIFKEKNIKAMAFLCVGVKTKRWVFWLLHLNEFICPILFVE